MAATTPALIQSILGTAGNASASPVENNFGSDAPPLIDKMTGKQKEEFLAKVNKWYNECRTDRMPFEREWYMNMAFYFGKQNVIWTRSTADSQYAKLVEPTAPNWRVRLVVNRIRPTILKEMAKLLQERPRGFVVPQSSDDDDLAAAKAGDAIYEHCTTQEFKLSDIQLLAIYWTCLTGNGFIKDWYADEEPDSTLTAKGRVKAEAISPFHILVPDLDKPEIEDQPYVIHSVTKTPEWIKETYGVEVTPDATSNDSGIESQFMSALGIKTDNSRKKAVIKEIWIKPCKDYPDGLVASWTGQDLLRIEESWLFNHKEYPFSKYDRIPTGRFYSQSSIVDLIPLQREYNRTRSQIIESKNRMSKPQLLAVKGTIDPRKVTSEPGLIIEYQAGFDAPKPLPLQPLPNYVLAELDRSIIDMNDISSQHEVSRGQVPPNVEAATAIAYLQEQDDTALAPTLHSIEMGNEKIGRHVLSHAGQFWDAERTIVIVGRNNIAESQIFTRESLRGNTAYKVIHGSATPRSRAAKQAFIMELMKLGAIPWDRGLQYLEYAETAKIFEEMQIDTRHAQRENLNMAQGLPEQVNDYDNNVAHINEHWAYMKRQEFEHLDISLQNIFMMHLHEHKLQLLNEYGVFLGNEPSPIINGFVKQVLGQLPAFPGMMMGPTGQPGGDETQSPAPEGTPPV